MVPAIKATYQKYPNLLLVPEREARSRAKTDERDERFRLCFWDEYQAATAQNRPMSFATICTIFGSDTSAWAKYYAKRLDKLAFILHPPKNYVHAMKVILDRGLDKLLDIMEMPIVNKRGEPDVKVITQIIKVFQLVDLRVKGSIIQRVQIQQQNLNVNVDGTSDVPRLTPEQLNQLSLEQLEALEEKLARVERTEKKMIAGLPEKERQEILDIQAEMVAEPPPILRDHDKRNLPEYTDVVVDDE
jgi:hypothetical protein